MSVNLADLVATLQVNATELTSGIDKAVKTVEEMAQSFQTQATSLVGVDNAAKGYIKSLERQAVAAGLNKAQLLEMKRVWDIIDYGDTEQAINKINNAYDKLEQNLKETQAAVAKEWPTNSVQEFTNKIDNLAGSAFKLGAILSASVTAPIVGLASKALGLASSFQQAEIAFTTMLGSGDKSKQFLIELRDFAARTPFEFPDLLSAAKRLQALGFAAEDTIPIMRSVGDAVAGLGGGAALIDRVTLALGQMKAKGKVSAEEMRQLAEAGIPAWQALADKIGVSVPEAMKMASKGAIQATEAIPAILAGMSERFGNLMQNQVNTAEGQFSNFKDQITFILADIGKELLPFANVVLGMATPVLKVVQQIATSFASLSEPVKSAVVIFTGLAAAVGPALIALAGFAATISSIAGLLGTSGVVSTLAALGSTVLPPVAIAAAAVWAAFELWKLESVKTTVANLLQQLDAFWNGTLVPFATATYEVGSAFLKASADIVSSGIVDLFTAIRNVAAELSVHYSGLIEAGSSLADSYRAILDSLSPLLEPLGQLFTWLGKLYAVLMENGVIAAWTILTTIWKAEFEVVKFLANLIGTVLSFALGNVAKMAEGAGWVFQNVVKPALTVATEAVQSFIGAIAQLPGVKQALEALNKSFDTLADPAKKAFSSISSASSTASTETLSNLQKLGAPLVAAREQFNAAQKSFDELQARFQVGKATVTELSAAAATLKEKKAALNTELAKFKPAMDAATKAVQDARQANLNANQALSEVTARFNDNKASAKEYADAQLKAKTAAETLQTAIKTQKDTLAQAGQTVNEYSGTVKDMEARWKTGAKAAKSLEDTQKELKSSVKAATQEYQQALRQYDQGKITMEQVGAAWFKLQEAQDKAEPEKAAKRHGEAAKLIQKQQEDLVKFFATAQEKLKALNAGVAQSVTDLSNDFAKAYEKIKTEATKAVAIIVPLNKRLPEGIQNAVKETQAVLDAYHQVGLKAPQELRKVVDESEKAWERIKNDAGEGSTAALQAEIKYRQAQIELAQQTGQVVTEEQRKWLEAAQGDLDSRLGKQESSWSKFSKQVSLIVNDLAKDVAAAFVDFFKGFFDDSFNEDLREQTAAINEELATRTEAFNQFNQDVEQQMAAVVEQYATSLAEETNALMAALGERVDEYNQYVTEVLTELDAFKQTEADRLNEELTELAENLAERESEYQDYLEEVGDKQREIREETADQLAATLNDLEDSLRDGRQAYEDFVNDANRSLARIGEDITESISDIQAGSTEDRLKEDKKYNRKVLDLNEDLVEAQKKGDKAKEASIKRQLREAEEDYRDALAKIARDEEDAVSDAKRRAQRQTEDIKTDLETRARDFGEFLDENAEKQQEAIDKAKKREQDQLASLEESVKKRTDAILKLREDTNAAEEKATADSVARVAKEEEKVLESIQKRADAFEKFRAETEAKIEAITKKSNEAQAAELAQIAKTAVDKAAEYEKFKNEALKQIEDLESQLQGPLDRLRDLFGSVFESATNAILRLGSEAVLGWLIKRFKDDFGGVLDGILGTLSKIFGIGGSSAADAAGSGADAINNGWPTGGGATSGAGSALGGLGGIVDLITGAVSAVANVVTAIYSIRQEGTQNAIEENTRITSIHAENLLNKVNEYLPTLADLHTALLTLILPTLREIRDVAKNFVSVNLDLGDSDASKLISSIISRVGYFDTTATDRLLDINSNVVNLLGAMHDNTKQVVGAINSSSQLIMGTLGAIEAKAPSLLEKILGFSSAGILGGGSGGGGSLGSVGAGLLGGVTSGFGGFLASLMNGTGKDQERIEENTRFTAIAMVGPAGVVDTLRTYLPLLEGIVYYFANVQSLALNNIQDALSGQIPDRIMQVHDLLQTVPSDLAQIRDLIRDRPIVVPVSQGTSGNQFYITYSANDPRGWAGLTEEIIARGGKV